MAFYKYFYDLAESTTYTTHTVGAFDANCTTGAGVFKWVPNVNNTTITNIPGVRIKPTATTVGYWERVSDGPVQVGWFGCQNTVSAPLTFAALGISQATLNARYGNGFATTADYYDNTAIRYALRLMGTLPGYQSLEFESTNYWLSRACDLPINYTDLGGNPRGMFILNGNGANFRKVGTAQFNFFQRIVPTQTAADNTYIDNGFTIINFKADGSGGTWQNSGTSFLNLGATYGSIIQNIYLASFDIGIRAEFCMNATIDHIMTNNIKSYSVWVRNGSWSGAGLTNAGSNVTEVSHVRAFDTLNQIAAIAIIAADTCNVRQCIVEGGGSAHPRYGVLVDTLDSPVVPNVRIQDIHIECAPSVGGVYFKTGSFGRFILDGMYFQHAHTAIAQDGTYGDYYPDVYIANIPVWPTGSKLMTKATNSGGTWDIDNVRFSPSIATAADIVNPANSLWDLTQSNTIIPLVGRVRYQKPILL
jgi:hypothetical protein